jgi:hypothetical protein
LGNVRKVRRFRRLVHEFFACYHRFAVLFLFSLLLTANLPDRAVFNIYVLHLEESEEEEEGDDAGETEEKKDEEGGEKMEEGGAKKAAEEEKGEKEKTGKTDIRVRKFICLGNLFNFGSALLQMRLWIYIHADDDLKLAYFDS